MKSFAMKFGALCICALTLAGCVTAGGVPIISVNSGGQIVVNVPDSVKAKVQPYCSKLLVGSVTLQTFTSILAAASGITIPPIVYTSESAAASLISGVCSNVSTSKALGAVRRHKLVRPQ